MAYATLVSIDAWRSGEGGWDWNNQHQLATFSRAQVGPILERAEPRKVFAFLRDEGYLSEHSKGRVRLDTAGSDPDYLTIEDKNTGEPLFSFIVRWDED